MRPHIGNKVTRTKWNLKFEGAAQSTWRFLIFNGTNNQLIELTWNVSLGFPICARLHRWAVPRGVHPIAVRKCADQNGSLKGCHLPQLPPKGTVGINAKDFGLLEPHGTTPFVPVSLGHRKNTTQCPTPNYSFVSRGKVKQFYWGQIQFI